MTLRSLIPWPTLWPKQRPAPSRGSPAAPIPSSDAFQFHQLHLPTRPPKPKLVKRHTLKLSTHLLLCALLAAVILTPAAVIWLFHTRSTPLSALIDKDFSQEIAVTPEYAASVRAAGLPITVQRAFKGSHVGGINGDGSEILAQRYPPAESAALVEALKRRNPNYTWSEVPTGGTHLGTGGIFARLVVRDFLPANDSSMLLYGHAADAPAREILVDRSRGILYYISSRS